MGFYLRAQLANYTISEPLDLPFELVVQPANSFVFVPPVEESADNDKKEQVKPFIDEEVSEPGPVDAVEEKPWKKVLG